MYTQLFQKPPMSEKLLSKPPFKYLFDVVLALKSATHFAEGLYSDQELDANLYNVHRRPGVEQGAEDPIPSEDHRPCAARRGRQARSQARQNRRRPRARKNQRLASGDVQVSLVCESVALPRRERTLLRPLRNSVLPKPPVLSLPDLSPASRQGEAQGTREGAAQGAAQGDRERARQAAQTPRQAARRAPEAETDGGVEEGA